MKKYMVLCYEDYEGYYINYFDSLEEIAKYYPDGQTHAWAERPEIILDITNTPIVTDVEIWGREFELGYEVKKRIEKRKAEEWQRYGRWEQLPGETKRAWNRRKNAMREEDRAKKKEAELLAQKPHVQKLIEILKSRVNILEQ